MDLHTEKNSQLVSLLVEARPDLHSQIVNLLRRRAFTVEGLSVGPSQEEHVARVTVRLAPRAATGSGESEGKRLVRELGRFLYLLAATDLSEKSSVARELALIKVAVGDAARAQAVQLCELFRAHIAHVGRDCLIVESTGDAEKIAALIEVLRPFGVLEIARSGPVALARGEEALRAPGEKSTWLERRHQEKTEALLA